MRKEPLCYCHGAISAISWAVVRPTAEGGSCARCSSYRCPEGCWVCQEPTAFDKVVFRLSEDHQGDFFRRPILALFSAVYRTVVRRKGFLFPSEVRELLDRFASKYGFCDKTKYVLHKVVGTSHLDGVYCALSGVRRGKDKRGERWVVLKPLFTHQGLFRYEKYPYLDPKPKDREKIALRLLRKYALEFAREQRDERERVRVMEWCAGWKERQELKSKGYSDRAKAWHAKHKLVTTEGKKHYVAI